MKKKIKLFSLAIAAALVIGAVVLPAAASEKKYSSMLVLGDSISTGYGLENYTPGGSPYECRSYCNILAESLGLKGRDTYINRAVNGDASDDLLALLPSVKEQAAKSDLIVVSIGGNDLLHILPKFAASLTGKGISGVVDAANAILAMDKNVLADKLKRPETTLPILTAVAEYSVNLGKIITTLHEYNPDARVIFLAQYNPMAGVAEAGAFGTFAGTVIDSLNAALRSAVAASGYGYEVADIPSVINVNAEGYTNISSLDIHPNGEGHELMGKYMTELVAAAPVPVVPETSAESEPVTEPVTEPPVTTEAPAASAAATEAPETTVAPETTAGEKRGCGSSVAAGMLLAVLAGAVCLVKKRK